MKWYRSHVGENSRPCYRLGGYAISPLEKPSGGFSRNVWVIYFMGDEIDVVYGTLDVAKKKVEEWVKGEDC